MEPTKHAKSLKTFSSCKRGSAAALIARQASPYGILHSLLRGTVSVCPDDEAQTPLARCHSSSSHRPNCQLTSYKAIHFCKRVCLWSPVASLAKLPAITLWLSSLIQSVFDALRPSSWVGGVDGSSPAGPHAHCRGASYIQNSAHIFNGRLADWTIVLFTVRER
jgi:hypothetical protein